MKLLTEKYIHAYPGSLGPRMNRTNRISLSVTVTRLRWAQHETQSSNN